MSSNRRAPHAALLVTLVVALGASAGVATATDPGPGVKSTVLAKKRVGKTMYTYSRITLPPGQSTGWHFHNGPLYAVVERGTLTHDNHRCRQDGRYRKGDLIVEPAGRRNVHIGRNLGTTPVVLRALYVDPVGKALAVSAPNPGCPFQ